MKGTQRGPEKGPQNAVRRPRVSALRPRLSIWGSDSGKAPGAPHLAVQETET